MQKFFILNNWLDGHYLIGKYPPHIIYNSDPQTVMFRVRLAAGFLASATSFVIVLVLAFGLCTANELATAGFLCGGFTAVEWSARLDPAWRRGSGVGFC